MPCMVNSWLYCSLDRNCRPGQRELGAHEQRHQPADEEEDEAGDAVHDADQLVIGGGHQLVDQVALGTQPRRERTACLEFSDWGRFGYQQVLQKFDGDGPRARPESYLPTGRVSAWVLQTVVIDVGPSPTGTADRPRSARMLPSATCGSAASGWVRSPRRRPSPRPSSVTAGQRLRQRVRRAARRPPNAPVVTSTTKIAGAGVLGNQRRPDESCAPEPAPLDPDAERRDGPPRRGEHRGARRSAAHRGAVRRPARRAVRAGLAVAHRGRRAARRAPDTGPAVVSRHRRARRAAPWARAARPT